MVKLEVIASLKPVLKEMGFKKIRNFWYRIQNGMTFYLNIQGSCYNSEDFYVNLGVVLGEIDHKIAPIYEWDIRKRLFADKIQVNHELEDILCVFYYFLDFFSTPKKVETFIKNQKSAPIIVSGHYMLI